MRLIQLKLGKDHPFWFLAGIRLDSTNPRSSIIDFDLLPTITARIIKRSAECGEVRILDVDGKMLPPNFEELYISHGMRPVDTGDVEKDDSPPISCVTVELDTEEDSKKEVEDPLESKEDLDPSQFLKEAKMLLSLHGNAIKARIKKLDQTGRAQGLLLACLKVEKDDKKRPGILGAINQALMEMGYEN
jgi:hypothetical protein